jgi:hypothetical protein
MADSDCTEDNTGTVSNDILPGIKSCMKDVLTEFTSELRADMHKNNESVTARISNIEKILIQNNLLVAEHDTESNSILDIGPVTANQTGNDCVTGLGGRMTSDHTCPRTPSNNIQNSKLFSSLLKSTQPRFDGKSSHVVDFIEDLDKYVDMGDFDDPTKVQVALCLLSGSAKEWGKSIKNIMSYSEFKQKLLNEFWSDAKQLAFEGELNNGKYQYSPECSMGEYFTRLLNRARHLRPPKDDKTLIRTIFKHFSDVEQCALIAARCTEVEDAKYILAQLDERLERARLTELRDRAEVRGGAHKAQMASRLVRVNAIQSCDEQPADEPTDTHLSKSNERGRDFANRHSYRGRGNYSQRRGSYKQYSGYRNNKRGHNNGDYEYGDHKRSKYSNNCNRNGGNWQKQSSGGGDREKVHSQGGSGDLKPERKAPNGGQKQPEGN